MQVVIIVNSGDYSVVGPFDSQEAAEKHLEENGWRRSKFISKKPDSNSWEKELNNGLNIGVAFFQRLVPCMDEVCEGRVGEKI